MRRPRRTTALAALLLALSAWGAPEEARAQSAPPRNAALIDAVRSNPAASPQLTAQEVAAGAPDNAASVVGDVVGVLPSGLLLSLVPRVVWAALAALAAPQREPQAPAVVCAAIRAVPASERPAVAPTIVAAAVAIAPAARALIVACAIETVPQLASPATSPLPGSTIGRDAVFQPVPPPQLCASPPCP